MFVLLINREEGTYDPPMPFGPFASSTMAAAFAEKFREVNGLPREATSDNNEAWTNAGWYFGIFQLQTEIERWA